MKPAVAFAAVLLLFAAAHARAEVSYDVPIEWSIVETRGDYEEGYQTSLDPAQRIVVLVRTADAGGMPAAEWALFQSDAMRSAGVKTGAPLEQHFGDTDWWYVDWKDEANEGGRRYFSDVGRSVVEVSLVARQDVFRAADASQFDAFLASFRD